MSDVSHPDLIRAFELIEREEQSQARILLDAYLETYPRDADAWWLYAHTVNDPMDAQDALRHVLKLDPQYPGARDLLNESEQALIPRPVGGISRLSPRPTSMQQDEAIPDFLNQLDDDDDVFGDDEFDTVDDKTIVSSEQRSRRPLFILAAAFVTILLIGGALLLLNMSRQPSNVTSTTPTSVINNPTPTNNPASTSSISNVDATQDTNDTNVTDFTTIYTALSDFDVIGESAIVETTSLGSTFLISVCNDPSGNLVKTTTDVLDRIAQQSGELVGTADFIGARILNCQRDNLLLLTLAVSIIDAQALAEGNLSAADFQTRLQRITN